MPPDNVVTESISDWHTIPSLSIEFLAFCARLLERRKDNLLCLLRNGSAKLFDISNSETTAFEALSFGHIKTPAAMASFGFLGLYESPFKVILTFELGSNPKICEANVVFPLPIRPVIETTSFSKKDKSKGLLPLASLTPFKFNISRFRSFIFISLCESFWPSIAVTAPS